MDFRRGKFDGPVLPRELVGRHAPDLLCGKGRWSLIEGSGERAYSRRYVALDWFFFAGWLSLPVVGVRGEAKPDLALVDLRLAGNELSEARGFTEGYRQDAGCHRVERAEVAGPGCLEFLSNRVDDVVRRHAFRLVDDQNSVHSEMGLYSCPCLI